MRCSRPASDHTLVGVAERAGLDAQLVGEVMEAAGMLGIDMFSDADVDALRLVGTASASGLPREALVQLTRVFADGLARLAEAETRLFHIYVHEQFRAQGMSGRELLEATNSIARPLLDLIEPAILYFHRLGWERASREDLLRHLAEAVSPASGTLGEITTTLMFVDLASYTPMAAALGDEAAADVLRRFSSGVRNSAHLHAGNIVKQIGDAFMLVFAKPEEAIRFGLDLRDATGRDDRFPGLHLGAHHGSVLYREGDYVGTTVNIAARVTAASTPGQFLVTEALGSAVGDLVGIVAAPVGSRSLKGIAEPIPLFEVTRQMVD